MLKLMTAIAVAMTLASVPAARAEAEKPKSVATQCGEQWQAFKKENGKPAKGEGREMWSAFYKACREKLGTSAITASDKAKLVAAIAAYKAK